MSAGINVVAILGGLGSQMFKYAFFLNLKRKSSKKTYIDLTPFDFNKMWNGYELSNIFGVEEQNIYHSENVKVDSNVNYYINTLNSLCSLNKTIYFNRGIPRRYYKEQNFFFQICNKLNQKIWKFKFDKQQTDLYPDNYFDIDGNVYFDEFDHKSDLYFCETKDIILETFRFPSLEGDNNLFIAEKMLKDNSVAIHVRRSDHLYDNGELIHNNFYIRSIETIKNNCNSPSFFVFSDDISWCKRNISKIGLNSRDLVFFVDWNKSTNSYLDMQLMTYCQHNIVPFSAFSWWGCYLSPRKHKMTFAPVGFWDNIKFHF